MSYDISLIDRNTKHSLKMNTPQFITGGTIPAEIDPTTGKLVHAKQISTEINITYNYSNYYYEIYKNGIRELYGKTAKESIDMLNHMIKSILNKYKVNDEWIISERTSKELYDEDGNKIKDPIGAILHNIKYTTKEIKYTISEGDTSDYWEATAANAITPLYSMLHMAVEHVDNTDAVWDGD